MLDIDHFKRVNDNYGHTVGDEVIRRVSSEIKQQIRDLDIAGRYGGEEFGIILTDTDGPSAVLVAERIRQSIESLEVHVDSEVIKFTVSLGIQQVNSETSNHTLWMEKADKALYQSKDNGRNQVTLQK
jgi:diguanylate cyclase (GGDEF)-like protein